MYYLLLLSVVAASLNSIALNKAKINKNELFKFNLFGAIVWCVVLFALNAGKIHMTGEVLFWGVLYGLTQASFILFKTLAMRNGSVSVTTLIGNCSLLISIFVSTIVWKENVTIMDVVGLGLLLVAIALCTYKKTEATYTAQWKYYVLLFFILAAMVGIVFKAFGKSAAPELADDMMFIAAAVMLVCYFICSIFTDAFNPKTEKSPQGKFIFFALLCGLLSCLYNRLNIFLAGNMAAIIFFPAFNGSVVLLSAFLSVWICKEKLSAKQKIGILLGACAICIIGIL